VIAAGNPRFPLFDSLRAIAALSVFTVHLPFLVTLGPDSTMAPYLLDLKSGVAEDADMWVADVREHERNRSFGGATHRMRRNSLKA